MASPDMFVESAGKVRIHIRRYDAANPEAVLVMAHGFQSHAGWFDETGRFLAAHGVSVLAFDRRGSGRSEGPRGDVRSAADFEMDLAATVHEASKLGSPVHLLANCFATRFALPYVDHHPGTIRSLVLTSPATDMRPEADYSAAGKLGILFGRLSPVPFRVPSPLEDELFVSTDPWLKWIHNDELSLRKVTPRFLMAARHAEKDMFRALSKAQTPVFVMLATKDRMVFNDRIRPRFDHYSGPVKVEKFESEHMLEFGSSAERYRLALLDWIRVGHRSAHFASQRPPVLAHAIPSPAMWLANGSPVDFEGLEELDSQIYGFGGDSRRFEGFFDQYAESELTVPPEQQTGKCLSPEAEWAVVFTDPVQLNDLYVGSDPKHFDARIRALRVELRGMIEGKWLDVLRDEAVAPFWAPASADNNVVASGGLSSTVGALDTLVRSQTSRVEVFVVPLGGEPGSGESTGYFTTLRDIRDSEHFQAFSGGADSGGVLFSIVRAVLDQWHRHGAPMSRLRAINLSALGVTSALVVNKDRQEAARAMKLKQILLRFGRFISVRGDRVKPRIGMHLITSQAVTEGTNGLNSGFDYLLIHTGPDSRELGRARLRLGQSRIPSQKP